MLPYTIIQPDQFSTNLMHSKEIIHQMIDLYLDQGRQDFAALQQAIDQHNFAEIHSAAHHIKPTMQYIGADDLKNKFQQLEDLASDAQPANKQQVNESIDQLFSSIKKDFQRALLELTHYKEALA